MRFPTLMYLVVCILISPAARGVGGAVSHKLATLERAWQRHRADDIPFRNPTPEIHLWRGRALVTLTTDSPPMALVPRLRSLGMDRISTYDNTVSGWIPIDRLHLLDGLRTVIQARAASPRTTAAIPLFGDGRNGVVSQGDAALQAIRLRKRYGVDGRHITIGILSDSYDCLGQAEADIAAGELPRCQVP